MGRRRGRSPEDAGPGSTDRGRPPRRARPDRRAIGLIDTLKEGDPRCQGFGINWGAGPACSWRPAIAGWPHPGPRSRRINVRGTRVASPNFVDGPAPLRTALAGARRSGRSGFEDEITGRRGIPDVLRLFATTAGPHVGAGRSPTIRTSPPHMRTPRQTCRARNTRSSWPGCAGSRMRRLPRPDTEAVAPSDPVFSQPIPELRGEAAAAGPAPGSGRSPRPRPQPRDRFAGPANSVTTAAIRER